VSANRQQVRIGVVTLAAIAAAVTAGAQVRTPAPVHTPASEPARAQERVPAQAMGVAGYTPRRARTSDAVIARDLAWFDSLESAARSRRVSDGASRFTHARAAAYVALARDAYERNDAGAVTSRMLQKAGVQSGAPAAVAPVNRDLWTVVTNVGQASALSDIQIDRLVALEVALVRAEQPLLGAPSCRAWQETAQRLASELRSALKPDAPLVAVGPAPTRPEPAPVPATAPVAPPPRATPDAAPRELRGVPSRVHFALDRSDLASASQRVLNALADSLSAFPAIRIVLFGHTDMRASAAYNAALSRRRAVSVQRYLIGRGISADRMSYEAKGKSALEMSGQSSTEHARNRRVEMQFIAPDGTVIPSVQQLDDLQLETGRTQRR
jgi:outer membrane protein OmpA-like peptidoglycan-associated protein